MERCGTCKHWSAPTGFSDAIHVEWRDEEEYDDYAAREQAVAGMYRICKAVPENPDDASPGPLPLAAVTDGSGYKATFWTSAEYGCVLHEPQEDA